MTGMSLFFVFGALMSGLTAFMLSFSSSPVDVLWQINPRAHEGFSKMGSLAPLLMFTVCLACGTAAVNCQFAEGYGHPQPCFDRYSNENIVRSTQQ